LKIPTRALYLVCTLCGLLALINIGSTTAFFAILSLATLALYISYLPPILFFLLRKLEGRQPARGPFSLGRWGIPINIFALVYGVFIIIWLPFPTTLPVTKNTFNYSGPIWIGCFILALIDWFVSGHKRITMEGEVPAQAGSSTGEKEDAAVVAEKLPDIA
jgi:choline transport protein